ncbi:hypothetical protein [Enterobacter asburiae]|uniref:hypothetical protein n=1 Tax=Enterobacter asburiae TaxID=61645 RepID=UPI003EE5547B
MLNVKGCEYLDQGKKRIYTFSNLATAVEVPEYPGIAGLKFYDVAGHAIHKAGDKREMKQAIARYKSKWRLAK